MRHLLTITLAALAAGLLLATITMPTMPQATAGPLAQARATATPRSSQCVPAFDKVAGPREVRLGEEVTITLTAKVLCPYLPLHLVLVLPASDAVPEAVRQQVMASAETLVRGLKLAERAKDEVGVVSYAGMARTLCELTNDTERLIRCIHKLQPARHTAMDAGMKQALQVLSRGRGRASTGNEPEEAIVLYGATKNTEGCGPLLASAGQIKGQKVLVATVCSSADCDADCLRQVAAPDNYFQLGELSSGYRPEFRRTIMRSLTIADTFPPDMVYVAGSAFPEPAGFDPVFGLTWTIADPPRDGVTITFRVKPMAPGQRPTNIEASGQLLDYFWAMKDFVFPVPVVNVQAPPAATPTETRTPTRTATPSMPTCTPPPCPCGRLVGSGCPVCEVCTPTPVARPAYLPGLACWR